MLGEIILVAEEETTQTKLIIYARGCPNIQVHVVGRLTLHSLSFFLCSYTIQSGVYYSNKTEYTWIAESNSGYTCWETYCSD